MDAFLGKHGFYIWFGYRKQGKTAAANDIQQQYEIRLFEQRS